MEAISGDNPPWMGRMSTAPGFDWRDPRPYSQLRGIDRAGLMWEWLRRDTDYIAWYARASKITGGPVGSPRDLAQWGLHFRGATGCRCARGLSHLARRS